jgi:predicted  nucleic acid-binding Zn-ribbon protein
MKTSRLLLIVPILVLVSTLLAQEQSDYEVTQTFQKKYTDISKSIENAQTVQECAEITTNIDDLEKEYTPNKTLLDKALYPDNFDKKFTDIRARLAYAQQKLGIIQDAVNRITDLEAQVKTLSGRVDSLTSQNEEMMKEVTALRASKVQDEKSLDSLRTLVAKLESNVRERDKMIFSMVDSIFGQYDKDIAGMKDVGKQSLTTHLEHNRALENIRKAVIDNVAFLESTNLSASDIAALVGEQKKFASNWNGLGPKLTALYVNKKERSKDLATIDTMVDDWGKRVDAALWQSLNGEFTKHNLTVKPFASGSEFYNNVASFVDDETNNVNQQTDATRRDMYAAFVDSVWNGDLQKTWIPMMLQNGMLSQTQVDNLNSKVESWHSTVQPSKTLMYIIIAIVVLALALVLFRRMRKPNQPTATT